MTRDNLREKAPIILEPGMFLVRMNNQLRVPDKPLSWDDQKRFADLGTLYRVGSMSVKTEVRNAYTTGHYLSRPEEEVVLILSRVDEMEYAVETLEDA